MPELGEALEQLGDFNRRAARSMARRCSGPGCVADDLGLAFRPGARVMDLVTGKEGVIVDGTRENIVVPVARGPQR
jgi:hypothetical protein